MVEHAAARCHSTGRDDDLGSGVGGEFLGFLHFAHIVRDAARRFALGAGQAMLVHEIAHQPARVDRHRAVEEDRDVAEASLRAQTREMIEKRLDPSHGEGRDHHRPSSLDASFDMISKRLCRIDLLVAPIAIGRFH